MQSEQPVSVKSRRLGPWIQTWQQLDQILRGDATRPEASGLPLARMPMLRISTLVLLMAVSYGFCMAVYAMLHGAEVQEYHRALGQTMASMVKVPLLFGLTLVITFPSLYVFNALVGSQLRMSSVFRLLIASLAVNVAVLASLGPILAFFSASTPNYHFIVLLNVAVFTVAGVLGLSFLLQSLNRLSQPLANDPARPLVTAAPSPSAGDSSEITVLNETPSPLEHPRGAAIRPGVRRVFGCWILVFGLVGAQMGWVLRPFIGSPTQSFSWFRSRQSNFFEAVCNTFWQFVWG